MASESYLTLSFLIRKARQARSGECPIFARITITGQRAEFLVNRSIDPENWNSTKGKSSVWPKEDELKALKSDLAALDRKITAELAPKHDEKDGEEIKPDSSTQRVEVSDNPSQSKGTKESMVAEPRLNYSAHKHGYIELHSPPFRKRI